MDYWGLEASVDLINCDPNKIRDSEYIKQFTIDLCTLIDMKRYGEPVIVDFGEEERVSGYSMFQLIETSNVSAHFANATNNVYLNVFSCKMFDPELVEQFAKEYFDAERSDLVINYRK